MTTPSVSATSDQIAWLAARVGTPTPKVDQAAWLAVLAPPKTKGEAASQIVQMAPYTTGEGAVPEISQVTALGVYATGIPDPARSRAWTFTLDGHTFYVLDLGTEGTFAYDVITKQWCSLYTQGYMPTWNFAYGVMWGDRIVGADILYPYMYELDPNQTQDEGWRPILHVVTGAVSTRSLNSIGCALFHLTGSSGFIDSDTTVEMSLRFSDDNGNDWSDYFTVEVAPGDTSLNIQWAGLGSFSTPGRIFEVSDSGGLIRIDGADAGLGNFDDDETGGSGQ